MTAVLLKNFYDKIKDIGMETLVADAGYKTPAIAKLLVDDRIRPLLPYKRSYTKKEFFKKYEYVYDEYHDCYICPNYCILEYSATNREGYKEYKSCGKICESCPYLEQCTLSRYHVKVITRRVWEDDIEKCEDIRNTIGIKVGLTFACMNLKKLAKMIQHREYKKGKSSIFSNAKLKPRLFDTAPVCLQSAALKT